MLKSRCIAVSTVSSLLAIPGPTPAAAPAGRLYVGTDVGVFAEVKGFDYPGGVQSASFFAYSPTFTGGVRVAAGDVNNDRFADIITGAGPGAGPHVKVFNGDSGGQIHSFFPFTPGFMGGVYVAAGDLNGDGVADLVVAAGQGAGPQVSAFDGVNLSPLMSFQAYDASFTGGVRVAVGDVNGDGTSEIITAAGPGGGPHVKIFSGSSGALDRSFFAFGPNFLGGVYVGSGDINGDGADDIIAGTDASGGQVNLFSGADLSALGSIMPFGPTFTGGVRVAAADLGGDSRAELIVGSGPGAGQVQVLRGGDLQVVDSFFPFGQSYTGGVFVAGIPEPAGALALGLVLAAVRRARRG